MDKLVLFNNASKNKLTNKRNGEPKFGQHIKLLTNISNIYEQLKNLDVSYVLFGIKENIGSFASKRKSGTEKVWETSLKYLLNIESNKYTKAKDLLILGYLDFGEEMEIISNLDNSHKKDIQSAMSLISEVDRQVSFLINIIVLAGKKPIVIGGGQNNAYGNIKGMSLALNAPVNALNFSLFSGFAPEEGRHNNNGFSYAFAEGFLNKYFVFGLQENYTSDKTFTTLNRIKAVRYNTFESIKVRESQNFNEELDRALKYVSKDYFGLEINCNSIENMPSTFQSSSSFSINEVRKLISYLGKNENAQYLHISEAIVKKKTAEQTGKLISYFITDFIKG